MAVDIGIPVCHDRNSPKNVAEAPDIERLGEVVGAVESLIH